MLQTISRGSANEAGRALINLREPLRMIWQSAPHDTESMLWSSVFEECISAIAAVAAGGVDGLHDVNVDVFFNALEIVNMCRNQPGCEARIRSIAPVLTFCLDNDLDYFGSLGFTTGTQAAQICCSVFARDESGSEFTFTAQQIDALLIMWSDIVQARGFRTVTKPGPDRIMIADLCVSDANKPLLLANASLIAYLVDALLLDPAHPRAELDPQLKAWCQTTHAEARKSSDCRVVPATDIFAKSCLAMCLDTDV